jgi:hypothetical protein
VPVQVEVAPLGWRVLRLQVDDEAVTGVGDVFAVDDAAASRQ